ncbi:GTPase HflX [Chlamydiales bacterium SCGC AB-751-O23]|jgi:GTPase|nr:GTPase HflX [Chlamydiales bacterium SCGC AB-751-O23]
MEQDIPENSQEESEEREELIEIGSQEDCGTLIDTEEKARKALLVGAYKGNREKDDCFAHLEELERLADTLGLETAEKIACHLRKVDASTYIGSGKVEELVGLALSLDCEVIIFDNEISPSQQRNLEKHFEKQVMDRTELIIEVFAQRAQTHEAKIQIEIARIRYQAPRLKRLWTHLSRQKGGGVHSKGDGETQLEIDKQLLQKDLLRFQGELKEVRKNRENQKKARKRNLIPSFAIVGYTNAGKSTLMNSLTEADVLAEDKLFATLDTITRKFLLPNHQEILLTDTVGFIRKIPHTLVEAFKSTLEESVDADILLHLVDVSHPHVKEQFAEVIKVLEELKADEKPIITVLNKVDVVEDSSIINYMRIHHPKTVCISAKTKEGIDDLFDLITKEIKKRRRTFACRIPQSEYGLVSEVIEKGNVIFQDYEENDVVLRVEVPVELAAKLSLYGEEI